LINLRQSSHPNFTLPPRLDSGLRKLSKESMMSMTKDSLRGAVMNDLMKKVDSHDGQKEMLGTVTFIDLNGNPMCIEGVTEDSAEQIGVKYGLSGSWVPMKGEL
jgi:predicted RNA-binding protein